MTSFLDRWLPKIWLLQAAYYLVTGIWPLVGIESFQKVSGRKTDLWLVKTVGVIVTVIGAVIGSAGVRKRITPEIAGLAIGSASGLATIEVIYAGKGRISRIYLLDALLSVVMITAWVLAIRRKAI
jgi:hypothetical protein